MARIVASIVEQALSVSADPLAAELLARLRAEVVVPTPAKATRPFSRRAALQIYSAKAATGDGPTVRTDGYPTLLATLSAAPEGETIVHGVTFADAVYLVFTDPGRKECVGVLRKRRLEAKSAR
jgi:hypothetical protein